MKSALVLVDIQKDFCPGGALAVSDGDRVIGPANRLIEHFQTNDWAIFLTRDWHTADHCSFKENGGIWPPHCIAETEGAAFHSDLCIPPDAAIMSKAVTRDNDAYSGFEGTDLKDRLAQQGVTDLVIVGLATDYCVKNTVLDALKNGFAVTIIKEGIQAVNINEDDGAEAVDEMKLAGAGFVSLADYLK